jgi:hypothetical protein
VGMKIITTIMENNMQGLQQNKNRTTVRSSNQKSYEISILKR